MESGGTKEGREEGNGEGRNQKQKQQWRRIHTSQKLEGKVIKPNKRKQRFKRKNEISKILEEV